MARKPRRELIAEDEIGIYHIYSRNVRRTFLFGEDSVTGKSYDHRMELLRTMVRTLARVFAIDILGYGFMQNHFHEILRNRPDIAARMSGCQVAVRIVLLEELGLNVALEPRQRTAKQLKRLKQKIENLVHDKERLQRARATLCSISRYEQRLKQTISRIANLEDGVTGHFWEGRFESIRIEDEEQLLTTMVYVDLNAVRAGIATTPETSRYTSVYDRIHALQGRLQFSVQESFHHDFSPDQHATIQALAQEHAVTRLLDDWLSPIDERRDGVASATFDPTELAISDDASAWTAIVRLATGEGEGPSGVSADHSGVSDADGAVAASNNPRIEIDSEANAENSPDELLLELPQITDLPPRASNKGCFSMTLYEYIRLVDWTGRQLRADKRGQIPAELSPILDRLGLADAKHWFAKIGEYTGRLKNAFTAPVNQAIEAARCVIQTEDGPRAFPESML
ncbi:MAG: hypothetical protein KDB23_08835 [Planctomycetales bacterium]|nr:hypothetical protein [Planctomycetales bacterium]